MVLTHVGHTIDLIQREETKVMSDLFVSYQSADPLAHSVQVRFHQWASHNWDFPTVSFHEQEPPVRFTERGAGRIKRELLREIKRSQQLLVMISRTTWQSEWTDWEISMALAHDKQLLAAKLDSTSIVPLGLLSTKPVWIDPFDPVMLTQRRF